MITNDSLEPNNTPPDFDLFDGEPEPPDDFFPSAPSAPTPVSGSGGSGLKEIAVRLGVNLPPEEFNALKDAGESLNLCKDDALWILILLQVKAGAAFRAVPAEVTQAVNESTAAAREAALVASRSAAAGAADETRRAVTRMLLNERRTFGAWGAVAGGISFFVVFLAGFFTGNFCDTQSAWVIALAKHLGF